MTLTLRTLISAVFLAAITFAALPVAAQTNHGDEKYQPNVGQEGKDVIWVPTADELVMRMLQTAKVTANDVVYDLGAGDGKIPIAAALQFGARAVGIEYNPEMAELARRNAQRAGVSDKVKIIRGDIFVEDFSEATVLTLYLLPDLNLKLRPTILKMKPGTRVVSHAFTMGDWDPDQVIDTNVAQAYYWVVPADVAGEWVFEQFEGVEKVRLNLTQKYQSAGGTITVGKKTQPILGAQISGDKLSFRYINADGVARSVKATISGARLEGEVQGGGAFSQIKATRK
jgi:SAM-dependent methyltransferase